MTNLAAGVLHGSQEPRYRPARKAQSAHADDCAFLASAYGLAPDPWQMSVLGAWLATNKAGKFRSGRCGLAVPRQNGKNAILEMVELYKMVVLGRKVLHTAHEVKTARKAFLRLSGFFENSRQWPELSALVVEVRRTNGQEAIVLSNGGSCEFIARSRGSGRGYTVDDLVCDEAQELTEEQLEALLPTISAAPRGDPQQTYTGTPPPPGSPGTVFRRMRDLGTHRKDKRLAWLEWSVSEVGDIFDRHRIAATNPALGIRLQMSVIDDELGQMSPEGFARERLGWWAKDEQERPVISPASWKALAAKAPDGPPAYGIKFSVSGDEVALAAAVQHEGRTHVEVLESRPTADGVDWLKAWLTSAPQGASQPRWRSGVVVVDGKSGAGELVDSLTRDAKVPVRVLVRPTVDQVITAHAQFLEMVKTGRVSHGNQAGLNQAVEGAGKRQIGAAGGWGWQAIGDTNVLPLDAATLATWGASTRRPPSMPRRLY